MAARLAALLQFITLFSVHAAEVIFETYQTASAYYPSFWLHGYSGTCGDTIDSIYIYRNADSQWYEYTAAALAWSPDAGDFETYYAWNYVTIAFTAPLSVRIDKTNGESMIFIDIITEYTTGAATIYASGQEWCTTTTTSLSPTAGNEWIVSV